jgi:hypothetical protein
MAALVYCLPVMASLRPMNDPDIWWHVRTGEWIVTHRAVPWTDPFSRVPAGTFWIAYNWLLDVVLYGLVRVFGFVGPVLYSTVLSVGVAALLHALMIRYQPRFSRATALTTVMLIAMAAMLAPRTYMTSILFFLIEIYVLVTARETGRLRPLLVLPPLFAVWANLHIQFVYGLLLLALVALESAIVRVVRTDHIDRSRSIPLRRIIVIGAASGIATVITPYHIHLHRSVLDVMRQTGVLDWVVEHRAMEFRTLDNWIVLVVGLVAVFVLGRQHSVQVFPTLLLLFGAFAAFRARRDVWVLVTAAAVVIALSSPHPGQPLRWLTWKRGLTIAVTIILVGLGVARVKDVSASGLERAAAREFPVRAAAVVEARGYGGPLYNHYDWGGYLIWRLPHLPVSMDGRANVYGDARIARSMSTWFGRRGWASDPDLADAKLVIGSIDMALVSLLRLDPRFKVVYEDDVAAVFVARDASQRSE